MTRANPVPISEHSLTGEKLSLLAVFAHPEDQAFGPAGTLARYASEGVQVSLVTATRSAREVDAPAQVVDECADRDRSCACRTSGVRRVCFLDYTPGELDKIEPEMIEDQIVRLMREIRPQVVITYGEDGMSDDTDHQVVSRVTAAAFRSSGDSGKFARHFREGLEPYAPQKLYYCVLPTSFVTRSGIRGLASVPDERVTTILDVSSQAEAMSQALFCNRSRSVDFIEWLDKDPRIRWEAEYYALAETTLRKSPRHERDLFAGVR